MTHQVDPWHRLLDPAKDGPKLPTDECCMIRHDGTKFYRRRCWITDAPPPEAIRYDQLLWFVCYDEQVHKVVAGEVKHRWCDNQGYAWMLYVEGETEPPEPYRPQFKADGMTWTEVWRNHEGNPIPIEEPMSNIDKDCEYALTWCKNGKFNLLGERVERMVAEIKRLQAIEKSMGTKLPEPAPITDDMNGWEYCRPKDAEEWRYYKTETWSPWFPQGLGNPEDFYWRRRVKRPASPPPTETEVEVRTRSTLGPCDSFPDDGAVAVEELRDETTPAKLVGVDDAEGVAEQSFSDEKNNRRCDLIDKDLNGTITKEERLELEELQSEMLKHRNEVAPLPIKEVRELHERLKAEQPKQERLEFWMVTCHQYEGTSGHSVFTEPDIAREMADKVNGTVHHMKEVLPGDPDPDERQRIKCDHCGRIVYAVPGHHTLPGGPPDCPNSHVQIVDTNPDDLSAEIERLQQQVRTMRGMSWQCHVCGASMTGEVIFSNVDTGSIGGQATEIEQLKINYRTLQQRADQLAAELEALKSENDRLEIMAGEGAEKLKQRTAEMADQRKLQPVDDNGKPICQAAFNHLFSEYQHYRDRVQELAAELEAVKARNPDPDEQPTKADSQ